MQNAFGAQMIASCYSPESGWGGGGGGVAEAGRLQKVPGDGGRGPGLQSGFGTHLLGNPVQVTPALRASVFPPVKWGASEH